jgi:uncharacterized SAM-binding protein YcdF (DUF218 family)
VFWLKKTVSFGLMPLPLCLLLLAAGLALVASGRGRRLGRVLAVLATVLLAACSNRLVSSLLLSPLEGRFHPVPELSAGVPPSIADCRFVVVLGGGNSDMPGLAATSQLSASALARLVEAVRILRALPRARLIVSGPGEKGHPTHASVLAEAAASLGVDPSRITQIDTARDTEDESHAITRAAGGARIALVTSAWHMPRAARLFERAGARFTPCPADFASRKVPGFEFGDLACDSESLERSTLAVHEWIGMLWLSLRGAG